MMKKKKKTQVHSSHGISSSLQHFKPTSVKPNNASIQPKLAAWPALLTASTFNQLHIDQYANSPDNLLLRTCCFFPSFTHGEIDGQAELAWLARLNAKMVRMVTRLNTNPARYSHKASCKYIKCIRMLEYCMCCTVMQNSPFLPQQNFPTQATILVMLQFIARWMMFVGQYCNIAQC